MMNPNMVVLYVNDTVKSRTFYSDLFQRQPAEASPNFSGFALESGLFVGLWLRPQVQPAAAANAGAAELAFPVADARAVDAVYDDWRGRGLAIAQAPTDMDFGRTFVALDPDGHRLRVVAEPAR